MAIAQIHALTLDRSAAAAPGVVDGQVRRRERAATKIATIQPEVAAVAVEYVSWNCHNALLKEACTERFG